MEIIENLNEWSGKYGRWRQRRTDDLKNYPFVENRRAPFTPLRRALPLLNLALISSAGAYIDGTNGFETDSVGGDMTFREIPIEVEAENLQYSARGYDPAAVREDRNSLIPIDRIVEFQQNAVIGFLNPVWWSFSGYITDTGKMTETLIPQLVERVARYEVQAALLIPASRLCHQSMALLARGIEAAGITTMMLAVERDVVDRALPPRCGYHNGELGSTAGKPNWKEFQRRILDESVRLIESLDQPTVRRLSVELQSDVEKMRGER